MTKVFSFRDAVEITSAPAAVSAPRYCCAECRTPTRLSDLNDDMLCTICGEPEEDPEDCEPTADELWRTERTW